jgi:hypothetical protein
MGDPSIAFSASSGTNQNARAFPEMSLGDLDGQHEIVATTGKIGRTGVPLLASGQFRMRVISPSRKRHRNGLFFTHVFLS